MDRPSSAVQSRRAGNSGCCNSRPWVLLDSIARTGAYCSNDGTTTARTLTSRGFPVSVSFELADPPAVSRCLVHCPGAENSRRFVGDPLVLTASQALVLLVISFTSSASEGSYDNFDGEYFFDDYFVYRAGPGRPRLDRIQMPSPRDYDDQAVGILPLRDGAGTSDHYALVIPVSRYHRASHSVSYNLRVFRSDRKAWTTKGTLMATDSETDSDNLLNHVATGVISVGGGVLGWVDLWWGILVCRVLDENPVMRLVQWPVPGPCTEMNHISARPFRDVVVVNGLIKFVELKFQEPTFNGRVLIKQGWTATIWKRMVSSVDWHESSTVHNHDVSITDSVLTSQISFLLPEILDAEAKRLTWDQVSCTVPTLGLTADVDVVYIMTKAKLKNPITVVLAVNAKDKTLEALEECCAEKMTCLEPTYAPSAFSSYLGTNADM